MTYLSTKVSRRRRRGNDLKWQNKVSWIFKNTNLAKFGAICVEKGQKERFLAFDNDRNSQVTEEKKKSNYESEEKERTWGE